MRIGHEFDVRLSTLQREPTEDSAIKGLVEPEGIVTIASSNDKLAVIDYNAEGHKPRIGDDQTIAEIIYIGSVQQAVACSTPDRSRQRGAFIMTKP